MEMTCREAYSVYLQTQGGCEERRFVQSICNIINNVTPYTENCYISYNQYRFLYKVMMELMSSSEIRIGMASKLKIVHALSTLRLGTYSDEERPIEDLLDAVLRK